MKPVFGAFIAGCVVTAVFVYGLLPGVAGNMSAACMDGEKNADIVLARTIRPTRTHPIVSNLWMLVILQIPFLR
jgi:hypothetical protein